MNNNLTIFGSDTNKHLNRQNFKILQILSAIANKPQNTITFRSISITNSNQLLTNWREVHVKADRNNNGTITVLFYSDPAAQTPNGTAYPIYAGETLNISSFGDIPMPMRITAPQGNTAHVIYQQ